MNDQKRKLHPRTKIKAIIDIMMSLLYLFLLTTDLTGIWLHELLGIVIAGLMAAHLIVNKAWFSHLPRMIQQSKRAKEKSKILLNAVIMLTIFIVILSGLLISRYLFPALTASNIYLWTEIHALSSWSLLGMLIIHALLHTRWIVSVYQQYIQRTKRIYTIVTQTAFSLLVLSAVAGFLLQGGARLFTLSSASDRRTDVQQDAIIIGSNVSVQTSGQDPTITQPKETDSSAITLREFLSKLHCTACSKHCPLSNPRCFRGVDQASQQTELYDQALQNGTLDSLE